MRLSWLSQWKLEIHHSLNPAGHTAQHGGGVCGGGGGVKLEAQFPVCQALPDITAPPCSK